MAENTLYFGDNLKILRDNIRDETVDLVFLDPPFNSKQNYNVLFVYGIRRAIRGLCGTVPHNT